MFSLPFGKRYYLRHPFDFISDVWINFIWALQRLFRGWDDRAIYNFTHYMAHITPDIMRAKARTVRGIPLKFFEKARILNSNGNPDLSRMDEAAVAWRDKLEKIGYGFECLHDAVDGRYETQQELEELKKEFDKGFKCFSEFFKEL